MKKHPRVDRFRRIFTKRAVQVIGETEKALLVCYYEGAVKRRDEVWVPKSHIAPTSTVPHEADEGDLVVSEWIAIQKGWLEPPDQEYGEGGLFTLDDYSIFHD